MDGRVVVNTEVLLAQASEVESLIGKVSKEFDELKRLVGNTNHYWIGEAGDAHREKYNALQPDVEEGINRLKENVTDLRIISGAYSAAEQQAVAEASALQETVIE